MWKRPVSCFANIVTMRPNRAAGFKRMQHFPFRRAPGARERQGPGAGAVPATPAGPGSGDAREDL